MKLHRILILLIAAGAGYVYYIRFHAVMNLTAPSGNAPYSAPDIAANANHGGLGGIGATRPSNNDIFNSAAADSEALMQAASKGDKEKLQKLLAQGVKVDARDNDRRTALMYAAWNGQNESCALLLAGGANVRFQDRSGNNAYDYAASRGLSDTVKFLLSRSNAKDDRHYLEYATLIQAANASDAAHLPPGKTLASINRITPDGKSPLHIAANNGSAALVDALLKRGADPKVENADRQTPLHWAAWNNQTAAMEHLLAKGAGISARDLAGNTPLILAVQNRSIDAVKLLLKKKADKALANKQGKTAFLIAEEKGYADLAALLQ